MWTFQVYLFNSNCFLFTKLHFVSLLFWSLSVSFCICVLWMHFYVIYIRIHSTCSSINHIIQMKNAWIFSLSLSRALSLRVFPHIFLYSQFLFSIHWTPRHFYNSEREKNQLVQIAVCFLFATNVSWCETGRCLCLCLCRNLLTHYFNGKNYDRFRWRF